MSVIGLAVKGAKGLKKAAKLPDLMPRAEREAALAAAMAQSKVRNEDGSLKRLYHGTTKDFAAFDKKASDPHYTSPQKHLGHFLTDDPSYANRYAEFWGSTEGANVIPAYANLTNPKMETLDKIDEIEDKMRHYEAKTYRAQLEALGHDGIIFEGTTSRGKLRREFVVFDPKQIKSAFNQGTYDPNDPDILKARGGHISTLAVKRKAKR